jgi:hypothetical protein
MLGYVLWYTGRAEFRRDSGLRKRFQLLQFRLAAPRWTSYVLVVFVLEAVLAYLPTTHQAALDLVIPVFLSIYPVAISAAVMVGVPADVSKLDTTAIEAIISYRRLGPITNPFAFESLWRNMWSYVLDRTEYAFRIENMLHMGVDFSKAVNVVALALTMGNNEEVTNAKQWLRKLRDILKGDEKPANLIRHINTTPSKFRRWFRMQKEYDISYVKSRGLKRLLRPMSLVERLLLLLFTALAAIPSIYFFLRSLP